MCEKIIPKIKMKNYYKVMKIVDGAVVEHSYHNSWDYAEIQVDLLRRKGISVFVMYRGAVVDSDVKRKKKKNEGL